MFLEKLEIGDGFNELKEFIDFQEINREARHLKANCDKFRNF